MLGQVHGTCGAIKEQPQQFFGGCPMGLRSPPIDDQPQQFFGGRPLGVARLNFFQGDEVVATRVARSFSARGTKTAARGWIVCSAAQHWAATSTPEW